MQDNCLRPLLLFDKFLLAIVAVKGKEVGTTQSSMCSVAAACAQDRVAGLPEKKGAIATNGLNSPKCAKRFQVATTCTVVSWCFQGFQGHVDSDLSSIFPFGDDFF